MRTKIAMVVWNEFLNDARVLKEAQTLVSAGYRVTVFALHITGVTQVKESLETYIDVNRVGRSPFNMKRNARDNQIKVYGSIGRTSLRQRATLIGSRLWAHLTLLARIVRSRPAIVHAHDVNTLPTAWLASVICRVPLVYDAHEISTGREGYASFRNLVCIIEKHLMPRAAGTITTTETRAKFFARAYRVPRPLVLQNRPRLTRVERTNRIHRELGLNSDWPIVLYQGGLQQGRGLELLVRAAAEVPRASFVFIGGGRLETALQAMVSEMQLEDRVHFIPTVPLEALPDYSASADIGVQPIENTCLNHFSTDSNKLFEYVIAGLPIVASDLPEIRRVVRAHDLGILVRPGDVSALVAAIRQLVEDVELRKHHSSNARAAADTLNWESQEDGLISLYDRVLNKPGNALEKNAIGTH